MKHLFFLTILSFALCNGAFGQKTKTRFKENFIQGSSQNRSQNQDPCKLLEIPFSIQQAPYESLTNAELLTPVPWSWEDVLATDIPFEFAFGDFKSDRLSFLLEYMATSLDDESNNRLFYFLPLYVDYVDWAEENGESETRSPVSIKTMGNPGSRITIIEYNNIGLYFDPIETDFVSFQLWLYEGLNTVEYHYGDRLVKSPADVFEFDGPIVGFLCQNVEDGSFSALTLAGDPLNPQLVFFNDEPTEEDPIWLDAVPPSGTVYRFNDQKVSVRNHADLSIEFAVRPNPFSNQITLKANASLPTNTEFLLFNAEGKLVLQTILSEEAEHSIFTENLGQGAFYFVLKNQNQVLHSGIAIKTK
jgi:hypothetical protein